MRSIGLLFSLLSALAALLAPGESVAFDRAYWNGGSGHSARLTDGEQRELDAQHIGVIYWQVGELIFRAGAWRREDEPARLPAVHQRVIPVLRLTVKREDAQDLFKNPEALVTKVRTVFGRTVDAAGGSLVIDFEGPDAVFPAYAAFLAQLHDAIPKLAATVPARWITQPSFDLLQQSVVELEVFGTDRNPIPSSLNADASPASPLDSAQLGKAFAAWSRSKVTWRAVFTSGATATVYGLDGAPRKILRDWSWSDMLLAPALTPLTPMANGIVKLRAQRATQIMEEGIQGDEVLTIAIPGRAVLAQCLGQAEGAGAAGAIFPLPTPGRDESGWSLRQLGHLEESGMRLTLRMEEARLVLGNQAGADLAPRCETADDRGYTLELLAGAKDWADVAQGDFYDLIGYKDEGRKDERRGLQEQANKGNLWRPITMQPHTLVPVPMANRLQLHFGFLRAGESLRTGFVRLTPGVELTTLWYRVLPIQTEWKPLD